MSLFDIFKKKKKVKQKPAKKETAKKETKPKAPAKPKPAPKAKVSKLARPKAPRLGGQAWRVLKQPHITEKATALVQQNQYVFKIWPRANKIEVKKAIEDLYGVEVKGVKIVQVPRKRRRLGRVQGWRKGYKKAIVKLKKGHKIEVLPR